MVGVKRTALAGIGAGLLLLLAGCPSPLLTRIKGDIAQAPFAASGYTFLRQWGNLHPEYSFLTTMQVKTDTAGFVYVADSSYRIRKFSASGDLQTTYDLGSAGLSAQIYDMAFDAAGNMYVTTSLNEIRKFSQDGKLLTHWGGTTLYGTGSDTGALALNRPMGIALDGSGNLYVADTNNNRIVEFTATGGYQTSWGGVNMNYGASSAPMVSPAGVATDRSGYVYVVSQVWDSSAGVYRNRILQFDSSGTASGEWGNASQYPPPSPAGAGGGPALSNPSGITIDNGTTQYLYVADTGNDRIVAFDLGGTYQTTWGTTGTANGKFTKPVGVAADTSGDIFVCDGGGVYGRVQKFTGSGVPTAAPSFGDAWGGDPGLGAGVLSEPFAIAFDSAGNLYVVDTVNNRVQKFNGSGDFVWKQGSYGTANGQFTFSDQTAFAIAVDAGGKLYVPDAQSSRVEVLSTSTGSPQPPLAVSPNVAGPDSVAVDSSGKIYEMDSGTAQVQVFENGYKNGTHWGTFGQGDGQFYFSIGLAVDSKGNVYTSDPVLQKVQKFDSKGTFLWKIDKVGSGSGEIEFPAGLAVDASDNLYIADLGNRRVVKFDSSGKYLSQIGGVVDATQTMGYPVDVAVSPKGVVAVTDFADDVIREYSPNF